jgi:hypothetical protein
MWRSKKWIIISILAAAMLLVGGVVGGVVYAQSDDTSSNVPEKTFEARVATILGIDQSKVEEAFVQAQKEMQDEALNERLNALVSDGKITQEQADQYKEWIQSRPDLPAGLGLEDGRGFPGDMRGMPRMGGNPPLPFEKR